MMVILRIRKLIGVFCVWRYFTIFIEKLIRFILFTASDLINFKFPKAKYVSFRSSVDVRPVIQDGNIMLRVFGQKQLAKLL